MARGQVGTIVEELNANNVLVEFTDMQGVIYAVTPIAVAMLLESKQTQL